MKFNFFNFCKHDYVVTGHIGGDIQNTAYKCNKCNKKYVDAKNTRCGKLSYQTVQAKYKELEQYLIKEAQK